MLCSFRSDIEGNEDIIDVVVDVIFVDMANDFTCFSKTFACITGFTLPDAIPNTGVPMIAKDGPETKLNFLIIFQLLLIFESISNNILNSSESTLLYCSTTDAVHSSF